MTPKRARAVLAFKRRLATALPKEDRCPGCVKARRLREEGNNTPPVCDSHWRIRNDLATGGRRGA